jgi:hypothetical protein
MEKWRQEFSLNGHGKSESGSPPSLRPSPRLWPSEKASADRSEAGMPPSKERASPGLALLKNGRLALLILFSVSSEKISVP